MLIEFSPFFLFCDFDLLKIILPSTRNIIVFIQIHLALLIFVCFCQDLVWWTWALTLCLQSCHFASFSKFMMWFIFIETFIHMILTLSHNINFMWSWEDDGNTKKNASFGRPQPFFFVSFVKTNFMNHGTLRKLLHLIFVCILSDDYSQVT